MWRGVSVFAVAMWLLAGGTGCEKEQPPPGTFEPMGPPKTASSKAAQPAADKAPDAKAPASAKPPAADVQAETEKPPPEGSVLLRWKLPKAGKLAYRAVYQTQPGPAAGKLGAAAVLAAKGVPKPLSSRLASMPSPGPGALTALLTPTYGTSLRVRMLTKDYEKLPDAVPGDLAQRLADADTGLALNAEISDRGEIHSAPSADAYALLELLFGLPRDHVLPGDTWKTGVDLLRGGDVDVEKKQELDQATLVSLKPRPGGEQLAVVEIAVAVIEQGKRYTAEGAQPVERSAVFVGRGELLVKAGRWQRFSGLLQTKDPTAEKRVTHAALKLAPLPSVPPKFQGLD